MDKIEYRAVIKSFVKEGLMPNEIHLKFINVYGDSSPSFSTIKKWAVEFKRGRTNLGDDHMKDVQKVQQHQKSLNKCTIWYWMTSG
jgi:L-ribulose-5-phosphate 3-epimerase UlaE